MAPLSTGFSPDNDRYDLDYPIQGFSSIAEAIEDIHQGKVLFSLWCIVFTKFSAKTLSDCYPFSMPTMSFAYISLEISESLIRRKIGRSAHLGCDTWLIKVKSIINQVNCVASECDCVKHHYLYTVNLLIHSGFISRVGYVKSHKVRFPQWRGLQCVNKCCVIFVCDT
ncbi:putative GTP cyclohydrolase II [Rosa chinensis]|uniref:Putative GTP cyclohydrolase II n=1 Tax=Rosa chinensis TaxID=74649 RepID=A0A2P6RH52_ROSCH|nr:putative GTP cyclohydrolase II [Rosa chinensis]